jgi:hypothetical protein
MITGDEVPAVALCRRFFLDILFLRLTAREKTLNTEIGHLDED